MPALIDDRALLPGERCSYWFSTPEDMALIDHAMKREDRRFVHLTRRPGISMHPAHVEAASTADDAVGCVLTIMSAHAEPFGRLRAVCMVGPRCRIVDRQHAVPDDGSPRPLRVSPRLLTDAVGDDAAEIARLHRELRARVLTPSSTEILGRNGLVPPLHCPERLSFWLCGLLMHESDIEERHAALYSTSSSARLDYCRRHMDVGAWADLAAFVADDEAAGQGVSRPWERVSPSMRDPEAKRALRRQSLVTELRSHRAVFK